MLAETIVGAEVENNNRRNRIKAMVGIDGTQLALNGIIERLNKLEPVKIPVSNPADRQKFINDMRAIRSEVVSTGMIIDEYLIALESIWGDYDNSSSFKLN